MSAYPHNNARAPGVPPSAFIPCRALAHELAAVGIPSIDINPDGLKAPARKWGHLQNRVPSVKEIDAMFDDGRGIAWIMRDGHEVLDFDEGALLPAWRQLVDEECPGLLARLIEIETPDNGRHFSYRHRGTPEGNQKLAEEIRPNDEGVRERHTLIETRGRGGYALLPGSPLACHPSGRPYVLRRGTLLDVPLITNDERDTLLSCARQLGPYRPEPRPAPAKRERAVPSGQGARPGDEYTALVTWPEILELAGWQQAGQRGGTTLWRRPGKTRGISATTGHSEADTFYCFTSNGGVFEPGISYSKFGAYAALEHSGDHRAAASALWHQGYGQDLRRPEEDLPGGGASSGGEESADPSDQDDETSAGFVAHADGAGMVSVDARVLAMLIREAGAAPRLRRRVNRVRAIMGDEVLSDGQKLTAIALSLHLPTPTGGEAPPAEKVCAETIARQLGAVELPQKDGSKRLTKVNSVTRNLADIATLGVCSRDEVKEPRVIALKDDRGKTVETTILVKGFRYRDDGVLPGQRMSRDEAKEVATRAKTQRDKPPRCPQCFSAKLETHAHICLDCQAVSTDVDAMRAGQSIEKLPDGAFVNRETGEYVVPGVAPDPFEPAGSGSDVTPDHAMRDQDSDASTGRDSDISPGSDVDPNHALRDQDSVAARDEAGGEPGAPLITQCVYYSTPIQNHALRDQGITQPPPVTPPPMEASRQPCRGGCGTLTTRGWECKDCRERSVRPLNIATDSAPHQAVWS